MKLGTLTLVMLCCSLGATSAGAATQADVFNPYCVSRVDITASPTALANLHTDPKGAYQPATMIVNVCGSELLPEKAITFRLKGSGSFETLDGKASFKIKMSSANRIDGLKSLTLNNMVQDESAIHESLAYKAFRAVGVAAPRAGYAIVSINGADYGLHSNIESVDDRFLNAKFGTWQHLYEGPTWVDYPAASDRDIVPAAVPRYELQEGSASSTADLTDLANLSTVASEPDWWAAFQQKFDVTNFMRFMATELYIGEWDGYANDVNNFFLHSSTTGVFDFLPWGKDQSFTTDLSLDPTSAVGIVFDRCLHTLPCRTAFRAARNDVAETIIGLDLVEEAHHLEHFIASAVAVDSRRHQTVLRQCQAVNDTIGFLIDREALWRTTYRVPASGITSAQTSTRMQCNASGPITPWPYTPDPTGPTGPTGPTEPVEPPVEQVETPPDAVADTPAGVLINAGAKFTKSRRVSLALSWPTNASKVEVSNDPAFAVSRNYGRTDTISWMLAGAPASSRSRAVFVRFDDALTAADTIAIDDDAPVIKSLKVRPSLASAKDSRYLLSVVARDSGSGAESVQIQTSRNRKPSKRPYSSGNPLSFATSSSEIRVRVIDRAGNASGWKTASLPG
jgi:hypothetical protein